MKTESNIDIRAKEIEKLKEIQIWFYNDIESTRAPKGLNEEVLNLFLK